MTGCDADVVHFQIRNQVGEKILADYDANDPACRQMTIEYANDVMASFQEIMEGVLPLLRSLEDKKERVAILSKLGPTFFSIWTLINMIEAMDRAMVVGRVK